MGYIKSRSNDVALGDSITDLVKCAQSAVGTAIGGATDPYMPEVVCRISQLQALSKDRTPLQAMFGKKPTVAVPVCAQTPPGRGGIGLEQAVKPLRGLVYVHRHPITVWAGLTAVLGVPLLVGYMLGKKR